MIGLIAVGALVFALQADGSTPALASRVAAAPPDIEFALVAQALEDVSGPDVFQHKGTAYRTRDRGRFRFATAIATQDELGQPVVKLIIDPRDATAFWQLGRDYLGRSLAILLDGRIETVVEVDDGFLDTAVLSPSQPWTQKQAVELATRIHSAGTAVPKDLAPGVSVSPFALDARYEPTPGSTVSILLETTKCFVIAKWPVYSILVTGDGSVWYLGEENVEVVGERTAKLTPEAVRGLLARFCAADFLSLRDREGFVTGHVPVTTLTLAVNGRTKRVQHGGVHETLGALKRAIEHESGAREWVKR